MNNNNNRTAQSSYVNLTTDREPFLQRAVVASRLTLPTLINFESEIPIHDAVTPNQSVGARGISHLSNKLLITLLPIGNSIMRLKAENEVEGIEKSQVEFVFSQIEQRVSDYIESIALRSPVFELIKHLLVGGNGLFHFNKRTDKCSIYSLPSYVCKRDKSDNLLELIIKESVDIQALPEDVKAYLEEKGVLKDENASYKSVDLYTCVRRIGNKYLEFQEIKGFKIPATESSYSLSNLPYMPLRFIRINGCSYGLGLAGEYIGDLKSLESLSRAVNHASAASAKVVFLVKPNSAVRLRDLSTADNGDFVHGNIEDVAALQVNKHADLSVAYQMIGELKQRLAAVFMLNSSVQRNAERVTAEEIRLMAQELESGLGGAYSLLAQEFQLPLVKLILSLLEDRNSIPKIPKGITPVITTGLDALGRGQDLNKLNLFLQYLMPLGPEVIEKELHIGDYMKRLAASISIDTQGLVKTDEEKRAEAEQQQRAMQQQIAMQAAPKMMDTMAKQQASQ